MSRITTADKYLSEKERGNIERWLSPKKEATKKTYRAAINLLFCYVEKAPDKLCPEDVSNFFVKECRKRIKNKEWSESYFRFLTYAVKSYIRFRYTDEAQEKLLEAIPLASLPSAETIHTQPTELKSILAGILKEDIALGTAIALAYVSCLSPKEIFKVRKSHLFKNGERLGLSVGAGKNHRFISLPLSVERILSVYIDKIDPGEDKEIFMPTSIDKVANPCRNFNSHLEKLAVNLPETIGKSLTIQRFRTIGMGTMSRQCDYPLITEYCKVSRQYVSLVSTSYIKDENPDSIFTAALDEAEIPQTLDIGVDRILEDDAYIAEYPMYELSKKIKKNSNKLIYTH